MGLQATNAGIDFQQRVSAFMMILMEFEITISNVFNIINADKKIVKINFEACESIDDLVLSLESGESIYYQMKRTISLSTETSSEFYKVCRQFVSQSKKNKTYDLAYVLMTRSEASGAIVQKLRRVLDGIRLSRSFDFLKTLNKDENEAINKMLSNIKSIFKSDYNEDITDEKLLELCMKIYIETLDIENGEAFEKYVYLLLYDKLQIEPILFWNALIARAVDYGANRRCVTIESLQQFFDNYKSKPVSDKNEPIKDILVQWKDNLEEKDIRFDFIIGRPTEKTQTDFKLSSNTILVIHMYRFLDSERIDGRKYVSPDMLYLKNGMEIIVMFRCSKQSKCEEFLESFLENEQQENKEHTVIVVPSKEGSPQPTAAETMHKSLIIDSFSKSDKCNCINCGKSITDKTAYMIEIDNEEVSNVAGIVHKECARPIDRIMRECILQIQDSLVSLRKFNVDKWIQLCKQCKTVWKSIELTHLDKSPVAVDNFDVFNDGNYSVCGILTNGNKRYLSKRGMIERFGKTEADRWMSKMSERIKTGKENNDPMGYSSETLTFCSYKQCLTNFPDEQFIECIEAKVEPYNQIIANIYNDSNTYYAPLIYFSVDGKPLILSNGVFPLISDPLKVTKCLENWARIGNDIADYELCIIENDNDFILKISSMISKGIRPIVDCLFLPSNELASGTPIILQLEVEAAAKGGPVVDI